jgi:membrane-bound lytic murein transglycosylase F
LRKLFLSLSIFTSLLLTTCIGDNNMSKSVNIDLTEIKKRGKIIAITKFNSINYFIYQGQPMGFQFELLQRFAEYSGLQLELNVSNDMDDITSKLLSGKCDIVAIGLPVTNDQAQYMGFTEPLMQSRQVLVQRKPDNWKKMTPAELSASLLHTPLELGGKTIVVQKGTAYANRLRNISNEIGSDIDVVEVPEDQEQLLQFVASGEVDYTVCDERFAQVYQTFYPQLDIATIVSFPQNLSWGIRLNSPELQTALNTWLAHMKQTSMLAILYNKYYQNQWSKQMVNNDYFVINSGRISPFDDEFKKYSQELNWDWRLLASLVCQESNFQTTVKSYAGAYGLMQITPATAQRFGHDTILTTQQNIKVGIMLLKWLDMKMAQNITDPNERVKFVMASYNVGIGHIIDAQLLAQKYGKNMYKWDDVKVFLLNKSKSQYYNDPLVKFGYCSGVQTVNYVSEVLSRFNHYKNITPHL